MSTKTKPYVIAEAGINHNGSLELAKELIDAALAAGADAVKFQLYDPAAVFGPEGSHPDPDAFAWAKHCELTYDNFETLGLYAALREIPLSASVFDRERLGWVLRMRPEFAPFIKIASRTASTDPDFVEEVIATGRRVIISDGMGWARDYSAPNVERLLCVSRYPALIEDALARMPTTFEGSPWAGYSDHTIGMAVAVESLRRGARVLEKHFTLGHSLPGPDHQLSATPDELEMIVASVEVLA